MTTDKIPTEALAQLRHLYAQLKSQDGMSRTDRARIADGILSPAIAALEKWGQPAQAAEPVAWLSPWRADQVTTDYDAYGKHGIPLVRQQPVAREPMANEHIRAMLNKHPPEDVCDWSYRMGLDDAELHHGIKGGQHVS